MKESPHTMRSQKRSPLCLFFIVLAFEIALTAYLILDRRMVIGHDGFQVFSHEWFFHNSKIVYGQMPLWTPYIAHGTPMAWWYVIQGMIGMSGNALLLFSGWLKGANFLPIFHGEFLAEKIILLIGIWLLGQRYFSSAVTSFFVATCVMSSTVVLSQYKFTFTLFYALPLILYLFHRFFDTGRGGWFWGAIYLFFMQTIGNDACFIPVISLAIFIYFSSYFYVYKETLPAIFQKACTYRPNVFWGLGALVLAGVFATFLFLAKDPLIAYANAGRNAAGQVGLNVFLSYGGFTDLWKWWEMLLRVSPQINYTVYIGMLGMPLVLVGAFCSKNSNKYPFVWGTVILLLFSSATPVSVLAYYFWPLMKFYRHIAYIAPLIKLYLCFLAGFGFEHIFHKAESRYDKSIFYPSLFVAGLLFLNSFFLCQLCAKPDLGKFMILALASHGHGGDLISSLLVHQYLYTAAGISLLMGVIVFVRPWVASRRWHFFIFIVLMFHCADVYSYAYQQIQLRSFSLSPQQYALMDFGRVPFIDHRVVGKPQNDRQKIVDSMAGVIYDASYNFTLLDAAKTRYRSDLCMKPLRQLFDNIRGIKSSAYLKLVGATDGKVQFFSNAHAASAEEIASAMHNGNYAADVLFYQFSGQFNLPATVHPENLDLSQNQRLTIPYKIIDFSPNEITLSVDTSGQGGVWMQYCDAWHPLWKARVNGRPQEVYIGNLAYKAIPLAKGRNIVRFYYDDQPMVWLYDFIMFSSLGWIIFPVYLLIADHRRRDIKGRM